MGTVVPYNQLDLVDLDRGDHFKNPMPKGWGPSSMPEGKLHDWKLSQYTTDEKLGLDNLRLIRDGMYKRIIPPGTYKKLTYKGQVVMSDTPAEAHEHTVAFEAAKMLGGRVLLNGLGMGWFAEALINSGRVPEITIIEKSRDVIRLVKPTLTKIAASKNVALTIIQDDAFTHEVKRNDFWAVVWHDIWYDLGPKNLKQMRELRTKYVRHARWQSCWGEDEAVVMQATGRY